MPQPIRLAVPIDLDPRALAGIDRVDGVAAIAGETMGTEWRVSVAVPAGTDLAILRAAIEQRVDSLVAEMSHWSAHSLLARFNRSAAGTWTRLPADFAAVMTAGLAVADRSGGAFDPAIGRLVAALGFGPPAELIGMSPGTPGEAREQSGWRRLSFDPATRMLRQPGGLWLDLSGIAKGYAADALAALLVARGHRHCLVEIGGECVGRGIRPDRDPWWVDLEDIPGVMLPPLRVALHELAVATSGNYVRGDHTIDPRTGQSVRNGVASVSVLHRSAMIADAWASALTVLGIEEGAALAEREGLAARIVRHSSAGTVEWISAALDSMF